MLNIGDLAPDFELSDQDGKTHKLSDYLGKRVVLYFYPKDNTPGCTKEACGFRDNFAEYRKNDIVVLGVSKDSEKSHSKFAEKYFLPFTLLSDTETTVAQAYGVWGLKKMMGREYYGMNRVTYVIDEEGKVLRVYKKVKPDLHAAEILEDIL
ncbi:MAG: thioredoxin-dependent thiol peroxidase [Anaerolineaceae bacterium]|jgi:peroxiredoxin Q/BCP